jgi:predicted enzyme related to lactoylglutathione lyase
MMTNRGIRKQARLFSRLSHRTPITSAERNNSNLRVRDFDAMVEQLRAANINVSMDLERYPNGRFARLHDPEGNPIELWQPK